MIENRKASKYQGAIKAVDLLWGFDESLEDAISQFCLFSGCKIKDIRSENWNDSTIMFRQGIAFLLYNGMRVPLKTAASAIRPGYAHPSFFGSVKTFERTAKLLNTEFQEKPDLSYHQRFVCRKLTERDWSGTNPNNLIRDYCDLLSISQKSLVEGSREDFIAAARAGFFYLATKVCEVKQDAMSEFFGFKRDRTLPSHRIKKFSSIMATYESTTGRKIAT